MQGRPGSSSREKTPFLPSLPSAINSSALGPLLGLARGPHLHVSPSPTSSASQWYLSLQPGSQVPLRKGRTRDSTQAGCVPALGYHSAIKRNVILIHIMAWVKFKNVMLSIGGRTWKTTRCMIGILFMCNSRKI